MRPIRTAVLAAALAASVVSVAPSVPSLADAPAVPAAAATKLDAFRKVPWTDHLKPAHAVPAPDVWKTRCEAEWALASLSAKEAAALLPLLGDDDRFVRALAARSLGIAQPEGAGAALIAALAKEKDRIPKLAIVEALGRVGGAGALEACEAQQGSDQDLSWLVGIARRQLKGGAWDLASIRGEHQEASKGALFAKAKVGEPAPEIALPGASGPVNLSTLRERIVVLVFAQGDRGGADAKVLQRLTTEQAKLDEWRVTVVVVDPHEKERTKAWADRLKLPFTFASDPAGRAAATWGVARQLFVGGEWLPSPSWCVIDRTGRLVWRKDGARPDEHASLGDLLPVLDNVQRGVKVW